MEKAYLIARRRSVISVIILKAKELLLISGQKVKNKKKKEGFKPNNLESLLL
jgi:hypothetical protein